MYIVIGKNGQLAQAFKYLLGDKAVYFSHSDLDFTDIEKIRETLSKYNAEAIINTCAYTAVDKAEEEEDKARKANALLPKAIATYCKNADIPFIHYSTDYVFSGQGDGPYNEGDKTSPINIYGKTKLEGERSVIETGGKYLIFRTSWVYDGYNKNFFCTMMRLGKEREELSVVDDQIGAPTYAPALAKRTLEALNNIQGEFPSGVYHLCGAGQTSWYGFASKIFEKAKKQGIQLKIHKINPIPSSSYPTPAKRPLNSRLNCSKAESVLKIKMPNWQISLEEAIESYKNTA